MTGTLLHSPAAWTPPLIPPSLSRQHLPFSANFFLCHPCGNPYYNSASPHLNPRPKVPKEKSNHSEMPLHFTQEGPQYSKTKAPPPLPSRTISNFHHHSPQPCSSECPFLHLTQKNQASELDMRTPQLPASASYPPTHPHAPPLAFLSTAIPNQPFHLPIL